MTALRLLVVSFLALGLLIGCSGDGDEGASKIQFDLSCSGTHCLGLGLHPYPYDSNASAAVICRDGNPEKYAPATTTTDVESGNVTVACRVLDGTAQATLVMRNFRDNLDGSVDSEGRRGLRFDGQLDVSYVENAAPDGVPQSFSTSVQGFASETVADGAMEGLAEGLVFFEGSSDLDRPDVTIPREPDLTVEIYVGARR